METLLSALFPGTPLWMWLLFIAVVLALLVLDLGVLNKGSKEEIGVAESLKLSALYVAFWASSDGGSARRSRSSTLTSRRRRSSTASAT